MSALRRLRHEGGFALPTAILIMMIVSLIGGAVLLTVNVETHQTGREVAHEASFNMAESALDASALLVDQTWPGKSTSAYPTTCNQSSPASSGCPGTSLTTSFATAYTGAGFSNPTWTVEVIDDNGTGGASYYSDSMATHPTTWDSNGDNRLWIRAQATIWGQKTIVVAQVVRTAHAVTLPQSTIVAGGVSTENNGNKIIIEAKDPNSGLTGPVDVRCADTSAPSTGDPCLGWNSGHGQLDPAGAYQASYVDPAAGYRTLSSPALASLKASAIANGTYYNGTCPTDLTGLVYVENANCVYQGGTWNSDAAPGALVFGNGTLEFNGPITYYGVMYMADGQGTTPSSGPCTSAYMNTVLTVHGGGTVHGGLFVDKCGTVDAGERQFDVNFDSNAFSGVRAWATPALAKNTFRIIPNS